jgi:CRP-like cAMP-binding protein
MITEELQAIVDLLLTHRNFAGLTRADFQPLVGVARLVTIEKGEFLFKLGDMLDEAFMFVSGRLEEREETIPGRHSARRHYSSGGLVASDAFIKAWVRRGECFALEQTQVLAIKRSDFLHLMERGDLLVLRMIDQMLDFFVEGVHEANRRLDTIHSRPYETLRMLRELNGDVEPEP